MNYSIITSLISLLFFGFLLFLILTFYGIKSTMNSNSSFKASDIRLGIFQIVSILLLLYCLGYCILYYNQNQILLDYPKNYKLEKDSITNTLIKIPLSPNEIGDSIGGVLNPIVGLVAAVLTFLAFYAQINANREQREQFQRSLDQQEKALEKQTEQFTSTLSLQRESSLEQKKQSEEQIRFSQEQTRLANEQLVIANKEFVIQDLRARRERFSNRYYLMLSIHRENVESIDIGRIDRRFTGRRAFLSLFNELKFIYWTNKAFYNANEFITELTENDIFQISYLTYFFGVGDLSTPMVLDLVGNRLSDFTIRCHQNILLLIEKDFFSVPTDSGLLEYDNDYTIGTGHLRRMSHYIRHLYQMVKYVDDQSEDVLNYDKKYSYLSNLRAQLSVHEQLLLYYNARSVLGKPWLDIKEGETESLMEKYCLIKSIPLNAADFFESPESYFGRTKNKAGKSLFEWNDIKERMSNI